MSDRDRPLPSFSEDGLNRRSLQERRLADQLRQNLLRRKLQQRARAATDAAPSPLQPDSELGED